MPSGGIVDDKLQWAISRILDKVNPSFFGDITITFQAGKAIKIKEESIETLPKELRD